MDDILFEKLREEYGQGVVFKGNDSGTSICQCEFMPTEAFVLDYVIGKQGIPLGRIIEIFGPFSTGKSSMCAHLLGATTRAGNLGVLIDSEHSWSGDWMDLYKIKKDHLYILQPRTFQETFEQLAFLCEEAGKVIKPPQSVLVVVDSLSALPTAEELTGEKEPISVHAKLLAKGLRILTNIIWEKRLSILFVSQLKDNPMMPNVASKLGGHAIDFHAALQLKVQRMQKLEDRIRLKITVTKNKVAVPFKSAVFDLIFNKGIDSTLPILQAATEAGLIKGSQGGWYPHKGKSYRAEELASLIKDEVYAALFRAPEEVQGTTVIEGTSANNEKAQ